MHFISVIHSGIYTNPITMKKCSEMQTMRAGCSKVEPKNFATLQTPYPIRGHRMAKIQSAGDGHYLYLQTQFGEDRCT